MIKSKIIAYSLTVVLLCCLVYCFVSSQNQTVPTPEVDSNSSAASSEQTSSDDLTVKKHSPSNIVTPDEKGDLYFTVASHDLGYFNYSTALHYEGEDADAQFLNWKATVQGFDVDFYFCQEYQLYFDKDYALKADDLFADRFKYTDNIYANYYGAVGIMGKHRMVDRNGFDLVSTQKSYDTINRPCLISSTKINGNIRIWLCSFSLFSDTRPETADAARREQLQAIMDNRWIKDSTYCILAGNFNSNNPELVELLKENGFTICNTDGTPTVDRAGVTDIDNIAVKGFEIVDFTVDPSRRCTSNHYPLFAKLKLIKE